MANTGQLLQRNKDFAATCAHEEASIIARHQVYVITCLDPRTDPSAFLELPDTITVSALGRTGGAGNALEHKWW